MDAAQGVPSAALPNYLPRSLRVTLCAPVREIRAKLSEPSGRAWDRLLTDEGITASGLIEALGRIMEEGRWYPSQRALDLARSVDKERRRR